MQYQVCHKVELAEPTMPEHQTRHRHDQFLTFQQPCRRLFVTGLSSGTPMGGNDEPSWYTAPRTDCMPKGPANLRVLVIYVTWLFF